MMPYNKRVNVQFDLRIVVGILLAAVLVMLALWQPWSKGTERTIDVVGEAKVSAEPDEFMFNPIYQFVGTNKDQLLATMSTRSSEVTAGLKNLGVDESKIAVNSNGYDEGIYNVGEGGETQYTLSMSITIDNKELATKVQDYLITTAPTGSVSPQAVFSEQQQNELEHKARDEAIKDARAKAEQTGQSLGFKLGKVKTVVDGSGFKGVMPLVARDIAVGEGAMSSPRQLAVQPGEQDLHYTVTVTYYLK